MFIVNLRLDKKLYLLVDNQVQSEDTQVQEGMVQLNFGPDLQIQLSQPQVGCIVVGSSFFSSVREEKKISINKIKKRMKIRP